MFFSEQFCIIVMFVCLPCFAFRMFLEWTTYVHFTCTVYSKDYCLRLVHVFRSLLFPLLYPPQDIVDIKPANMEELTEVITAAQFHPSNCNEFIYSSSKGSIRLCDMREKALCDQHAKCEETNVLFV